ELVSDSLPVRVGYPKAVISDHSIHIAADEDEFRSELNNDHSPNAASGSPYCDFPFVFGKIFHFSRSLSGGSWAQTEALDLHPGRTVQEVYDENMRLQDIAVANGTVYLLYERSDLGLAHVLGYPYLVNYYFKTSVEGSGVWSTEERLSSNIQAPYGYVVPYAKLFVASSGNPYAFFSGIDVGNTLQSGATDAYFVLKNLNSGAAQRQANSVSSIYEAFSYEPFLINTQSGGGYSDSALQHVTIYPTNSMATEQRPQLLTLDYSGF
ncbi:MAG: hypothetical protein QF645_09520, partial [Planctomycetota bacterium]|nr:hypothetical protein [Planctomycetota bacterium]